MKKAIFITDYTVPDTTLKIKKGDEFELEGEDDTNYYFLGFKWKPYPELCWALKKKLEGLHYILIDTEALH